MYGGYGNAWNQASTWSTGAGMVPGQTNQNQATLQNQQAVFNTNTTQQAFQQQPNLMTYGGNMASNMASTASTNMMGYMNMGMQANPFMNYGANAGYAMGMNTNAAVTTASSNAWLAGQKFPFQPQAFPGGQPPLPPGPPPEDKKDTFKQNSAMSQPPPPLPPSNTSLNRMNQAAPPPPPPPPPPSQQQLPNNSLNPLKAEDAYKIIKNAAALGMLPTNGPLAPLTSLNVSEELFGSKGPSSGIPGLDMTDEEKPDGKKSPGPEVIDLEKASAETSKPKASIPEPPKITAPPNDSQQTVKAKKEIVWELRPQVQNKEWTTKKDENKGIEKDENLEEKTIPLKFETVSSNSGWKRDPPKISVDQISSVSGFPGANSVSTPNPFNLNQNTSFLPSKQNINLDASNSNGNPQQGPGAPVRIPLESTDGKELVYDKKTLRQFDQKFREWENDFEKWKKANENHPDRSMYNQYLSQWNLWREQLVEQRRSILDTMNKARIDSTETFVSKMKMENDGTFNDFSSDKFSDAPFDANSDYGHSNLKETPEGGEGKKGASQPFLVQRQSGNPFQNALNSGSGPENSKRAPPAAPNLSKFVDSFEPKRIGNIQQPSNSSDNKPLLPDSKFQANRERDKPVERILRDAGGNFTKNNTFEIEEESKKSFSDKSNSNEEAATLPFEWSLPSQSRAEKNPFEVAQSQSDNPFAQPSGPNPFDIKPEQRLPSLDDFIKRTNLDFATPVSISTHDQRTPQNNPFSWSTASTATTRTTDAISSSQQVERIPRDPQANRSEQSQQQQQQQQQQTPAKTIRLEANPVGMPLLISAKENTPPPKNEFDEISHLFSRDRGPAFEDSNEQSNIQQVDDDDLVFDDTEVIDFGAGGGENSNDSMDFPRGENPDEKEADPDADFLLEDSEVIDFSQAIPPEEMANFEGTGAEYGGEGYGYPPGYEQGYPPDYFGPMARGRGRGRGFPPPWARGHPRGFPPGHPFFARGMPGPRGPYFPPEFGPVPPFRGRPYGRGMLMGRMPHPGFPPQHPPEWYQHDERELPPAEPVPEVVDLSPSPSPEPYGPKPPAGPSVKIAPPNPEFERDIRRSRSRSRSRERSTRGRNRSRSRSRDRVSRRPRDKSPDSRDRRRDDNSRRDRDRSRDRRSPDRRGRYDDRDRGRDRFPRDRVKRSRSRSRSKSPGENRDRNVPPVRNPLFPSASSSVGMLGSYPASSNQPPPRYQSILIEDVLNKPGRSKRPPRIVIFMRGLPGSGKSHLVKLIKEREVEMGGKAPRILSLDNYFTTEIEVKEKDPVTGVEEKKTVMEYEYDDEREPLYRAQLVRQFKKTLDEGYFSFVIVDCVNEFVRQFEEMAQFASLKRFQVYVAEIEETVDVCFRRNVHKRTRDEILKISRVWERTPSQFIKLDTRTLLQDEAIQDVEMEDVSDVEADLEKIEPNQTPAERGKVGPQVVDLELEDIEDEDSSDNLLVSTVTSKWDTMEQSQEKLNKLDGLMKKKRSNDDANVESESSIENWLRSNMPEDYIVMRPTNPGQKRVRWADIEERREQERMREVGFVVGQTDWNRMMDPTCGSSALTRTKFI